MEVFSDVLIQSVSYTFSNNSHHCLCFLIVIELMHPHINNQILICELIICSESASSYLNWECRFSWTLLNIDLQLNFISHLKFQAFSPVRATHNSFFCCTIWHNWKTFSTCCSCPSNFFTTVLNSRSHHISLITFHHNVLLISSLHS